MKNRVLGKLSWLTVAAFTAAALLAGGCEQYLENTDKKAAVTVTIEGTAQVDSTLTAKVSITGLTEEAIAALEPLYQWEKADGPNWTNIVDQAYKTYTPAAGDLNKYLRVGVQVEGYGEAFIKSEATAQVAAAAGPGTPENPVTVTAFALTSHFSAPGTGAAPATSLTATQYAGAIVWKAGVTAHSGNFAAGTVYTAEVTLTAVTGYTFDGVPANAFTHGSVTGVNAADSGSVTFTFPATGSGTGDGTLQITSADTGIMAKSTTRQFSASGAQAVTWSVEGSDDSDPSDSTTISNTGLLTVGADEPNITLTVKAVSTGDPTVEATATVKVKGWKNINLYDLFDGNVWGITYGAGKWVAVGVKGKIATSVDGESWEAATSPPTGDLSISKVIYDGPEGNKKFIALYKYGIAYSTDGGSWSSATITNPAANTWAITGIAYGNGKFIAVDYLSSSNSIGVLTSTDGINWTRVEKDFTASGDKVDNPKIAFGNNTFVCTLANYGRIVKTTNYGGDWTVAANAKESSVVGYSGGTTLVKADRLFDIVFDGTRFIAVGNKGRIAMSTNNDFSSWTTAQFGSNLGSNVTSSALPKFIIFAGGKYVTNVPTDIGSSENGRLMYASSLTGNGTTGWTDAGPETAVMGTNGQEYAAYGDGKFIAVGTDTAFRGIVVAHEETLE